MGPKLTHAGEDHQIEIVRRRPHLVVRIDGREHEISVPGHAGTGRQRIVVDGRPVDFARAHAGERSFVELDGRIYDLRYLDPREAVEEAAISHDDIKAPMPGAVVSVQKSAGDAVARGETIITIESMKLQTALPAPRDGVIAEILKSEGSVFNKDEIIARLEPLAEEA